MNNMKLKPYGIIADGNFIEDDTSGLSVDSSGNIHAKEFIEYEWSKYTAQKAINEAQSPDNLIDYTFATGWGGNGTNSTIDFFGNTVPCRVMGSTGDYYCYNVSPYPLIQSIDSAYLFSIWSYCTQKTKGNQYLGISVYNSGGSNVGVINNPGTTTNSNFYFSIYPATDSRVPKNKWTNYRGIVLPNVDTQDIGSRYRGNIVLNTDDMMIVEGNYQCRFNTDNVRFRMRFLDYYNAGTQSYSWWCLPTIIPIKAASITRDYILSREYSESY